MVEVLARNKVAKSLLKRNGSASSSVAEIIFPINPLKNDLFHTCPG
jgi:hypothetical protein